MNHLNFKIAPYKSEWYHDLLKIRYDVLRKPLGLVYTEDQLAAECDQVHIVVIDNKGTVLGGLILVLEENQHVKMRQVAIDDAYQQQGIGHQLILFAEAYAIEHEYNLMHCHARDTAIPFYTKLGYEIKGEEFLEVGIPHRYMFKNL